MRIFRGQAMQTFSPGLVLLALACSSSTPPPPAAAPPQYSAPQYSAPQYATQQAPQNYPRPTAPAPVAYPSAPPVAPAARPPAAPAPVAYPPAPPAARPAPAPVAYPPAAPIPAALPVPIPAAIPMAADPLDTNNLAWQRNLAQSILQQLVNALQPAQQARVQGIPLLFDAEPGEINAFASCSKGRASMAVTDGLLDVMSNLARAAAHDEVHRTGKTGEYILFASRSIRQGHLSRAPVGLVPLGSLGGPAQVARQNVLFTEQLAFVLGHELGHHYLGHLPCTGSSGLWGASDIARVFSSKFSVFSQGNEHQADVAGTHNLLSAGARSGGRWTQTGALLTLRFFSSLSGGQILSFQRSHPHPQVRIPVIVGTARVWQATGGLSLPTLPGL